MCFSVPCYPNFNYKKERQFYIMGKASRNKRENLEVRRAEADKKKKEAALAKRKSLRNKIIGTVCAVLAVLLLGSVITYNKMITGGFFLRRTPAVSSESYVMDNTLASYHFYSQYQNFLSQYGEAVSYFGLDTTKSLKDQECPMYSDGTTWYKYFMDSALSEMQNTLIFCEEAAVRGITLDDADYETIDTYMDQLGEQAKAYGVSKNYYVTSLYGTGVKEKDVRRAMEMSLLASKCYNEIVGEYSYTEADYDAYVKENPTALLYATYAAMTLSITDGMQEGDVTTDLLKEFEGKFLAAENKEAFDAVSYDYLMNYAYKNNEDVTEESVREEIAGHIIEDDVYTENDSGFMKWANEDSRKVNDVFTAWSEDGNALNVCMLLEPLALHTYDTVNVRHILLTADTYGSEDAAKAKAEELLAQWQAGEATAVSFGDLADQYSEDGAENGLYENVMKGDMVEAFDAWIYDDSRKAGDTGIVKTDYGYHVMYMEGLGMPAWHVEAKNALMSADYEEDYTALQEKYSVTVDKLALAMLDI